MSGPAAEKRAAGRDGGTAPSQGRSTATGGGGWLDITLFFALLCLLCVRPLMSESFERMELSFVPAGAGGPTPATAVLLDGLLLFAAVVALVRHPPAGRGGRAFAVALVCLFAATIASSAAANDRRVAANSSSCLVISIAAGAALACVSRTRWMASALVAALLASGAASAWKCIAQSSYEFRDTEEFWNEHERELAQKGWDLNAPEIVNYKRRLASREASGYLAHSNIEAECMTSWLLAGVGVLGAVVAGRRGGRRGEFFAAMLVAGVATAGSGAALILTRGRGAMVAAAVGLAAVIPLAWRGAAAARRATLIVGVAAGIYFVGIGAAGGIGAWRGSLPGSSLAFRWHYWSAAMRAWQASPLTGVGGGNFAAAYVKYKPVENPEEVRNPHNLWITLLVEHGPVALLAVAAMLMLWAAAALRRFGGEPPDALSADRADEFTPPAALTVPIVGVLVAQALFGRPETLLGGAYAIWAKEIALLWSAAYLCIFRVLHGDGATGGWQRDRWLRAGLVVAVGTTLIHNLVGFSLSTPAGLAVAAVCAAGALAPNREEPGVDAGSGWHGRRMAIPALLAAIAVLSHVLLVEVPTVRTDLAMSRMRERLRAPKTPSDVGNAVLEAERASAADPWDASLARDVARTSRVIAASRGIPPDDRLRWLRRAQDSAELAVTRTPDSVESHRLLGAVHADLAAALFAQRSDNDPDGVAALRAAASEMEAATRLYPTHAPTHLEAGKVWFVLWQHLRDDEAARSALRRFKSAKELDSHRPETEVMRLNRTQLSEIAAHLVELENAGYK